MILDCPCGTRVRGVDADALVAAAQEHLALAHPHLEYDREEILALARREPGGPGV